MDKLSKAQVAQVMETVGPTLRKLASERDHAMAMLSAYERQNEAEKVASVMIQKGATSEPYERVVAQMVKAAEMGELDTIRKALDMSGPDMGDKVASLVDDEHRYSAASATDFERFIVGDIG